MNSEIYAISAYFRQQFVYIIPTNIWLCGTYSFGFSWQSDHCQTTFYKLYPRRSTSPTVFFQSLHDFAHIHLKLNMRNGATCDLTLYRPWKTTKQP